MHSASTHLAAAQVGTLIERLFKLAAWVDQTVRRIVLYLPLSYPWAPTWRAIAAAVGATS
jgi:hypothetical protein